MKALCCSSEDMIEQCSEELPLITQRVNERSLLFRGGMIGQGSEEWDNRLKCRDPK